MSRTLTARVHARHRPKRGPDSALKALRLARRVIEAERREYFRNNVDGEMRDYALLTTRETRVVRRFDRTIRTINEALSGLSGRD